jgi:hypothetical protein
MNKGRLFGTLEENEAKKRNHKVIIIDDKLIVAHPSNLVTTTASDDKWKLELWKMNEALRVENEAQKAQKIDTLQALLFIHQETETKPGN